MKKSTQKMRQKLAKHLGSVFALVIFIIPTFATAKWLVGVYKTRDSRKVTNVAKFEVRDIDKVQTPLVPFSQPIITVTFDDGWESVYTTALPILQKNGFHSTQYIIAGALDNQSYMSKAQILSLQNAGAQIASHTMTHKDLTSLTDVELAEELGQSQKLLTKYFGKAVDFTSPLGAYNKHTTEAIMRYYRSHKNAEGDPAAEDTEPINIAENFTPYNIKSYSVRRTTTTEDINKLIQDAVKHNGWLVLTYHQVDNSGELYSVSPEALKDQLNILSKSPLRSATIAQVLDQLEAMKKAK